MSERIPPVIYPKRCDTCGEPGAILAPHTGKLLCDGCFTAMLLRPPPPEREGDSCE